MIDFCTIKDKESNKSAYAEMSWLIVFLLTQFSVLFAISSRSGFIGQEVGMFEVKNRTTVLKMAIIGS